MKRSTYLFMGVFIFFLVSCKDNKEAEEIETDTVEMEEEAFEEDLEPMASAGTDSLVVAVEGNPELSSFATSLNAWNVGDTINEIEGPFTVFAPSNAAYSTIYREQGQELLEVNNEAIVTYHIVPKRITEEQLKEQVGRAKEGKLPLQTLQGELINVGVKNGKIILGGGTGSTARVTESYRAGDGIVYVIDTVLLPEEIETEVEIEAGEGEQ